ncbi:ankyrin repeat domain-containing protein [Mycobacteroides abscessus]|uniref:ankyrin repeat domain-containing protein n=2 Tax=Mycobacteroides abscessus TaxID=36809 RepID=UPI0009419F7D|nr:ankyrin repeat domain-containing protein [Mycobacteroides abscessus]
MADTALHSSAGYNSVDYLRHEIASGLDINEVGTNGWTPLHRACMAYSYEAAKILLEAGAAVDPQDKWGKTPLVCAVTSDSRALDLVILLLEYGANPTIENDAGNSALKNAHDLMGTEQLVPALDAAAKRFAKP